jgi:TatD DNase family protein
MQFSSYDEDRSLVIQRALDAGIWMVNSGSNSITSEGAVKLAEKYKDGVYATVGIHPSHTTNNSQPTTHNSQLSKNNPTTNSQQLIHNSQPIDQNLQKEELGEDSGVEDFDKEKMRALAAHPKCVAIGECGLEYFSDDISEAEKEGQREMFVSHINLSYEINKPLVIHCRNAYRDTADVLQENADKLITGRPGLMHFFSGTEDEAREFLEMGFVFSFGGATTFPYKPGRTDFASVIRMLPLRAILLETDCPYVAPAPFRGKRNEPLYVTEIAKKVAEIRDVSLSQLAEVTTDNAMKLFAIGEASG